MTDSLFGVTAMFDNENSWREAIAKTREAGFLNIEAYAPYPDDEAMTALALPASRMPAYALAGGVFGAVGGYYLQYYTAVQQFPLDVAGRALNSWQAFMPITFEGTVLCAAIAILTGFFIESKFPQPHHPMFNVDAFAHASSHKYFLTLLSTDERFQPQAARGFLSGMSPEVYDVPA